MPSQSMPLFVSPQDVILRMQLDGTMAGVQSLIASGIIGSQLHVEKVLDSKFQRQSVDAMYFLDKEAFSGIQPNGIYRIEIPSGFLRQDTPVVVTQSSMINRVNWDVMQDDSYDTSDGPFGDFTTSDPTLYKVDYQRGYVLCSAQRFHNRYVRIQCDTGFEDGNTPVPVDGIPDYTPGVYHLGDLRVYNGAVWTPKIDAPLGAPPDLTSWVLAYVPMEQIPQDVYEAVVAMVPVIYDQGQTTNRSQEAEPQYKKALDHAASLLKDYTRTRGFSFRKMF